MLRKKERYAVAVMGVTGDVGSEIVSVLEEREFPVDRLRLFASGFPDNSAIVFRGREVPVDVMTEGCFNGIDIALFSAESEESGKWAPKAVASGCVVVDGSSRWRLDAGVPLVVPEVNAWDLSRHRGIVAGPGCATVPLVLALKPIHDAVGVERVVVTVFLPVSGSGKAAMDELMQQTADLLNFRPVTASVYPHQIAFNLIPQVDSFLDDGSTREETQVVNETRKIMGERTMRVTVTAVRVPVFRGLAASVNIETGTKLPKNHARALLGSAPGVVLLDAPEKSVYPLPVDAAGADEVYVGRVREDLSLDKGLNLWLVSDNMRKGTALNTVQIAGEMIRSVT